MTPARTDSPLARSSISIVGALLLACAVNSCSSVSEIVLVVDTDMAVPAELDRITITATGPSGKEATIPTLDLQDASVPRFPMTLGLVDQGTASKVDIKVTGFHSNEQVTASAVLATFVPGKKLTLQVVLSASCVGVMCASNETCNMGRCVLQTRDALEKWVGVPGRVTNEPAMKIGERSLWANGWRSCATQGQNIYCWGDNDSGQMGNGQILRIGVRRVAVPALPKPVASIGLGFKHTCICDSDGQAWCWGSNSQGQVGPMGATGPMPNQLTPVRVPEITDCVQIAGGGLHTCARRRDATVWCWGDNSKGQLGQPASTTSTSKPQLVTGLGNSTNDVQAGDLFTCAMTGNGIVSCWGDNSKGQVGDGTMTSRSTPVRLTLPTSMSTPSYASELSVGRFSSCLLLSSGKVACWGENLDTTLLAGPQVVVTPTLIPGIDDAVHVRAGHQHVCILRNSGGVSCWGSGQNGKLGNGQTTNSVTPVNVVGLSDVTEVAVGFTHSCARDAHGIACWGQNILDQLGDDSLIEQSTPVRVVGF